MKVSDLIIKERKNSNLIVCRNPEEYEAAKEIITEYVNSLDIDLEFQDIENEINHLANFYGPPTGLIIMAKEDDEFIGCVCIRNLGDFMAEIKRMYVKPSHRGKGLGRLMLHKAKVEAKGLGYRFLRLDAIPEMESAIHLFQSSGFYEIESYAYSPISGTKFMEYKL